MSQPIEETYVVVDADLDTADDEFEHDYCTGCFPHPGPAIALCGTWIVGQGKVTAPIPEHPCQTCLDAPVGPHHH